MRTLQPIKLEPALGREASNLIPTLRHPISAGLRDSKGLRPGRSYTVGLGASFPVPTFDPSSTEVRPGLYP